MLNNKKRHGITALVNNANSLRMNQLTVTSKITKTKKNYIFTICVSFQKNTEIIKV